MDESNRPRMSTAELLGTTWRRVWRSHQKIGLSNTFPQRFLIRKLPVKPTKRPNGLRTNISGSSTRLFLQTFYRVLDLSHANASDFSAIGHALADTAHLSDTSSINLLKEAL
jgi:hypothetical protein